MTRREHISRLLDGWKSGRNNYGGIWIQTGRNVQTLVGGNSIESLITNYNATFGTDICLDEVEKLLPLI